MTFKVQRNGKYEKRNKCQIQNTFKVTRLQENGEINETYRKKITFNEERQSQDKIECQENNYLSSNDQIKNNEKKYGEIHEREWNKVDVKETETYKNQEKRNLL